MKKRSSPLNVFFMRFNTGAIFAWISLSSACSSSARLYNGSTRKFTARLKKIIEIPAFPVILFVPKHRLSPYWTSSFILKGRNIPRLVVVSCLLIFRLFTPIGRVEKNPSSC